MCDFCAIHSVLNNQSLREQLFKWRLGREGPGGEGLLFVRLWQVGTSLPESLSITSVVAAATATGARRGPKILGSSPGSMYGVHINCKTQAAIQ